MYLYTTARATGTSLYDDCTAQALITSDKEGSGAQTILGWAVLVIQGYFMDKRPLQKLSKNP